MSNVYHELRRVLAQYYEEGEAKAIAFLVLEEVFGVSRLDIYAGKVRYFSEEESRKLQDILQRLAAGEPVQYVIGTASFCGLSFQVTTDTLIPRPETEELVSAVKEIADGFSPAMQPLRLLDAGTGTGCIAIALSCMLPGADVEAWDLSEGALAVARRNAFAHGAEVRFEHHDMLADPPERQYHIIVSNPPYIMEKERKAMERHVLDHEPASALFVPDTDPLLFYRALAELSHHCLNSGGVLAVEINQALGTETAKLFTDYGLCNAEIRQDFFGKDRMVIARKP